MKPGMQHGNPPPDPRLIFDWKMRERSWPHLLLMLLITTFGMVGLSTLFKVVYPQSQQVITIPQQILLLTPGSPESRIILNRALDKSYLLVQSPSDLPSAESLPNPSLASPVFRPTFQGREMTLKDWTQTNATTDTPRLFPPSDPLQLPRPNREPATVPGAPRTPESPSELRIVPLAGLGERQMQSPTRIPRLPLEDPSRVRFEIGVAPNGRVTHVLPFTTLENQQTLQTLTKAVSELRFVPTESGITWGTVTFRWESVAR